MEIKELRTSDIQRFLKGDADQLAQRVLDNDLNKMEREFLATLVRDNIPKRQRGPKSHSRKPIRAALIRFWRSEIDGWTELDAIRYDIECILEVSATMARKYLKQVDKPQTQSQMENSSSAKRQIDIRRLLHASGGAEAVEGIRDADLKPISSQ